jgi:uncharacterized BrkB/YihY/UPF0761 family membrane protein
LGQTSVTQPMEKEPREGSVDPTEDPASSSATSAPPPNVVAKSNSNGPGGIGAEGRLSDFLGEDFSDRTSGSQDALTGSPRSVRPSGVNPSSSHAPPESLLDRVRRSLRPTRSDAPPPSVLLPRGLIWQRLPRTAPVYRRFARGIVRLVQGVYHQDELFHAAPGMAFHFFLSLLPLLVFIGYALGLIAQNKGAAAVIGLLLNNLPPTAQAMISQEVARLASADRLGPLAAVGFFWIASGGTQGLMQAVERVVGVPRRAWWRQRLLAFAWVLGTLIAFAIASFGIIKWDDVVNAPIEGEAPPAAAAATAAAPSSTASSSTTAPTPNPSASASDNDIPAPDRVVRPAALRARKFLRGGGEGYLAMILSLLAAVCGLAGFYHFSIAHTHRVRRRVFPGAFLAIALVVVVSWGFSLYVRTLATYTVYYGSLAAIAVLLIWLWLISLAMLIGAELNSQLEGLRDAHESDTRD